MLSQETFAKAFHWQIASILRIFGDGEENVNRPAASTSAKIFHSILGEDSATAPQNSSS